MDETAPVAGDGRDASALEATLAATRELLWITTPADAKAVASDLVRALGGQVVPAESVGRQALPVDVSFGDGPPLLPTASGSRSVQSALSRYLPAFVRDAHRAVELAARTQRLAEDAEVDVLTGLVNRRVIGRALGRLRAGEVVVILDLDDFKWLNDTLGHTAGDEVLTAFGATVADTIRARDHAGRYGGDEFILILTETTAAQDVDAVLGRLQDGWIRVRPHPVTFSAGAARVGADPSAAVAMADAAMYEAKLIEGESWVWAGDGPSDGDAADRVAERASRS